MTYIDKRLPELVLSMGPSFSAGEVIKRLLPELKGQDAVPPEFPSNVSDFLDELVAIGILWKTGQAYQVRARPRGVCFHTVPNRSLGRPVRS